MDFPLNFRSSLLRCARIVSDHINHLLLPCNLNYSLWQVMYVIQHKQGCTSIEIADYLNVSKVSIAKRIHSLMQLDVLQQIETSDKRQKKLILSRNGQSLFQQGSRLIEQFEYDLTQHFDPEILKNSIDLLQQSIQLIEMSKLGATHE